MSNQPFIMDINESGTVEAANYFMRRSAIIIQLPSVYALFSMPNQHGADFIDEAKNRMAGKNYGTTIGNLNSFLSMSVRPNALTRTFCDPNMDPILRRRFEVSLNRAFLRINVAPSSVNNTVVRNGTHQALFFTGDHGRLFNALEYKLSDTAQPTLFNGNKFSGTLCSSANISGDPEGSITTWERAHDFAIQRNVPLIIRAQSAPGEQGSFPIFSIENDTVLVHREGPMLQELKANLEKIIVFDAGWDGLGRQNTRFEEELKIAA